MKRYGILGRGPEEQPDGEWVRYEDAEAIEDRRFKMAAIIKECRRYVLTPGVFVHDEKEYAELLAAINAALGIP
jgi:hypothetical protein